MTTKKWAIVAAVAVTSAGAVAGMATGGEAPGVIDKSATLNTDNLPVIVPEQNNEGAAHQTSAAAFKAHLDTSTSQAPVGSDLQSFEVAGTNLRGWTFSDGPRKCLALPDPVVEGYAVKCGTKQDVAAGEVAVVFSPPKNTGRWPIAAARVADGDAATVAGSDARNWRKSRDVYAGRVNDGATLTVAGRPQAVRSAPAAKLLAAQR